MKKLYRTYWPFALNEMKRSFAYKGSFYLFILADIFAVFINYYLWMAIYGSTDSGVIGGFSQGEMVIYVFMTHITSSVAMVGVASEIGKNIMDGSIANNLIKPIDYRFSMISTAFGQVIYRFIVPSLFIWIGLEIYCMNSLGMEPVSVSRILIYILSTVMSFFIYVLFDFCFGLLAFVTTYMFGLQIMKFSILAFLTGQLIPLNLFPDVLQKILDVLPFSSMTYVPVMIYLGKYDTNEMIFVLGRQAVWVILLYVLGSLLWKKVTKKMVVLGG